MFQETPSLALFLSLSLVLTTSLCPGQKKKERDLGWPFGLKGAEALSPLSRIERRDLYNLGVLGAKAWDADRPEPEGLMTSGRRRLANVKRDGPDLGPKRLLIRAIFPGGPAARAGLELGDIVIGVGQQNFEEGCFGPLAAALIAAESTPGQNVLVLRVERRQAKAKNKQREPETVVLDLAVKIPSGGEEAAKPTSGKAAQKTLAKALAFLAKRQSGDGGFPESLSGKNGAVVQSCLAGLAWIAGGSSLKSGKHRAALQKAFKFTLDGLGAKSPLDGQFPGIQGSWDQSTWAYAHAAIFLGELYLAAKSRTVQSELQKIADLLSARQELGGGYGHGPGGVNALGYIELNILGGYVLSGLSLARQAGCKVDDATVAKLHGYLQESGGQDGGVGYSAKPGQKGMGNIGRTAGSWLGCLGLGLGLADNPWTKQMEEFTRAHVGDALDGHASLMQHIMLGGLAARALGSEAMQRYWQAMEKNLVLARAPDGSLQPRPWHESLASGLNTDVSMGEVWTTASWAIVLGAQLAEGKKGGLPGWLGLRSQ